MATPFPITRTASGSTRLFPYALAATFLTIGFPFASVILVNHLQGFEGVSPLLLAVASISGAILSSALGTALWMQHPASNEVAFGDLMIWSWARSAQARRKLRRSFERLNDETEAVTPHDRLATLREMSLALDRKDPYTYGHSRRVERLAYRTGLALELSVQELQNLREAASIHDVGKIYVSDEILQKEGPLTDDEYAAIKTHAPMGAEMVAFLGRPELTEAVLHHHERWDGKGYPDGIPAASASLLARVIATVDAYDAMTSMRPYRASLGHRRAVEILQEEKGAQFDPEVVTAFLSTLRKPGLVAISVPLVSAPFEAVRRFMGWVGRNARVDLATAAGAVGVTVALTGSFAGNAGDLPQRPEEKAIANSQIIESQAVAADEAAGSQASEASDDDEDRDRKKNGSKDRKKKGNKGNKNEKKDKGSKPASSRGAPGSSSGNSTVAAGSGEVDKASDAVNGATASAGDPQAPGDPQPDKGEDCSGPIDSIGKELHCGD